jgi:hypothetical protein
MADVQIANLAKVGVPSSYVLPGSAEVILKCVNADFDGSGSGGDYLPCVTILDNSGQVVVRAVDQNARVAGGGDAEVSWFRGVKPGTKPVSQPRCVILGSANGTDTLNIPLTKAVPGPGVLHVVFTQATIGDALDTASAPDNVFDSNAVAGWVWNTATDPIIGLVRETISGSGPPTTSQTGGVGRPCTIADLGVGASITVHFTTASPALFHTAGLIVWQRTYWEAVKQFGSVVYSFGDDHPGAGASLTRMSWDDDFGAGNVKNDKDAILITAMGAYPPVAGFSPFVGTVIGEITSGLVSVAAVCMEAKEETLIDPGGTWPSPAIQMTGNYQYVEPRTFS